ncbi:MULTISPECIES: S1C family serine protease [unclassified Ornithinimicrobium]|uniref:S1C family serine protease n=1 Tax=unclassified Ornithinimicrobium TaxID=2615080 RepID=UPI0038522EDB
MSTESERPENDPRPPFSGGDDDTSRIRPDDTAPVPHVDASAPPYAPATDAPRTSAAPSPAAPAAVPAAVMPPPTSTPTRERGTRRWGDIAVASLLAAALASGGTYAAVRAATPEASSSTSSSTGSGSDAGTQGTTVALTGEKDWAAVAEAVSPGVVSIEVAGQTGQGSGSGVVWDADGHVVTNAHVVQGGSEVSVVLADGRRYDAEVVGSDPSSDLAVLRLATTPDGLTPVAVGDDAVLAVGDPVMAVGNPLGLSGTVTTGIVSALDRPVTTTGSNGGQGSSDRVVTNAIQTSAAINPGNSGGALVNGAGELVGINSSIAALPSASGSQAGSIGIGFAIPATKVQLIADQLIADGRAEHAFLGVALADGETEVGGATTSGALVSEVEPGSPAEVAQLQAGDLIVAIDDEQVSSALALVGQVRERASGEETVLDVVRDGQRVQVTATLATRPDSR